MKFITAFTTCCFALLVPELGLAKAASGQSRHAIQSAGVERAYLLHVPEGYDGDALTIDDTGGDPAKGRDSEYVPDCVGS